MYFVDTDDGINLAVEDMGPKTGEVVFFVHGWPLNRRIFEYQTNLLVQYGWRCISLDLRGFGQSDCPATGYDYNRLAKDVHAVVSELNLAGFTLAGFSMGGAIALRYMGLYGNEGRVKRVAFLAAAAPSFTKREGFPFGMTKADVNKLITQCYTDRPKLVEDFGQLFFGAPHSDAIAEWFKLIGYEAGGISTIQTAQSLRDEDLQGDMAAVRVPAGIFHGKLDRVCPYELGVQLHNGIPGSQLITFENSGHAVFYDELPKFNGEFFKFLGVKR